MRRTAMYKNILIADSEPNLTTALAFFLGHAGFRVDCAASYEQAIETARTHRPDIALIDTLIGGRSGYDLCQALLNLPGMAQLPVLMLTTHGLEVEREKALSLGAIDFLVKPFNPGDVLARVQELLQEAA